MPTDTPAEALAAKKQLRWRYYPDLLATILERGHREFGRVEEGKRVFYGYVGASHNDHQSVGTFKTMRLAKLAVRRALADGERGA